MSVFLIPNVEEALASLARKAKGDETKIQELREELFSQQASKKSITLKLQEILADFNLEYIENVITPYLATAIYEGERLSLPMIDPEKLTKEEALPHYLVGMSYDNWQSDPGGGVSVFTQGYEKRGEKIKNHRKRIYHSALTPDLYEPMYKGKITAFLDKLFEGDTNKPLMRQYQDLYFDLYWDLHLNVTREELDRNPFIRQIGNDFNTVLAYRDPTKLNVYNSYMGVRDNRKALEDWISEKIDELKTQEISERKKTLVYYWLENNQEGEDFSRDDMVFECFHNFVAFSQWGNTIYQIMSLSISEEGYPIQRIFNETMNGNYDVADDRGFTPLDRFVMELFRTIVPNDGSVSTLTEIIEDNRLTETNAPSEDTRYGYIKISHKDTSQDPRHWMDPTDFNPDRYRNVPTSEEIDEAKVVNEIGFAKCPFDREPMPVDDGRNTQITNSAFGTVYSITDETAHPVCDYAGYAPFGFGYRRCPGEQFTVEFIKDFLRKVWNDGIQFVDLGLLNAEEIPIAPGAVIDDNIGFTRST